ncbi:protein of unknown function [Pseudomonas sp. JV551A1]|nr:protein of unknown function [Pseudomonas sp. JV551A1]
MHRAGPPPGARGHHHGLQRPPEPAAPQGQPAGIRGNQPGLQIGRHLRGVPPRSAETAPRAGMPPGFRRLRLPGESAHFRDGLVPQAARRHPSEAAACARIEELHRDGRGEGEPLPADPGLKSDQHLAGGGNELVDQLLGSGLDHLFRATTTRAGQTRRGAEQAADHRALFIHRAAVGAQVHTVQALQGGVLLGLGLAWQAGHFFRRSGDRAAAVVAAGLALEGRDEFAQEVDLVAVAGHGWVQS